MAHVYIIKSIEGLIYVGSTTNLQKRLYQHLSYKAFEILLSDWLAAFYITFIKLIRLAYKFLNLIFSISKNIANI